MPSSDDLVEVETNSNLVEVEIPRDPNSNYLQRRNTFSFIFEGGYETLNLPQYVSPSLGSSFNDTFGSSPLGMFRAVLGAKWNLKPAAISLEVAYGQGTTSSDQTGVATDLNITKSSAGVGFWFDSIWSTPYVVPYAKFEAYDITYQENNSVLSTSSQTGITPSYTAGILLDLDFIDEDSSRLAYLNSNLKAVYLDIYLNHRDPGGDAVSFANTIDYGAALRVEY